MIRFNRTLVLLCLCVITTLHAAKRITLKPNQASFATMASLKMRYQLSGDYQFVVNRQVTLKNGKTKIKIEELYQGVPVWGSVITATKVKKNQLLPSSGNFLSAIDQDIPSVSAKISADKAIEAVKNQMGIKNTDFKQQTVRLFIKANRLMKASLVYHLSLYTHIGNKPTQIEAFVDAKNGRVIKIWEGLANALVGTGQGGNEKTGRYHYGIEREKLDVNVEGAECVMESSRGFRVLDIENGNVYKPPFRYTCPENTHKAINGGYSPLNDAYYYTDITHRMYKEWYNELPWTSFGTRVWVHYLTRYENYHWINGDIVIGDGADSYYPQTSLDVIAHEISHSFIKRNADLPIDEEPGTVAESFCDMAGEVSKYYLNQNNDWVFGANIIKHKAGIRFFENPEDDGQSVSHYKDYSNQRDPHYNAGIINKAFYLLSHTNGWTPHKAFDPFVLAAEVYWNQETTLNQAAHDVGQAAIDLNYDEKAVCDAFAAVGLSCALYPPPGHEPIEIHNGESLEGIEALENEQRLFKMVLPNDATDLSIDMRIQANGNPDDDADLYVRKDVVPTLNQFDCAPRLFGSNETCHFYLPKAGSYFIMLNAATNYRRVKLSANYLESGCAKHLEVKSLAAKKGEEHFYRYCPTQPNSKVFTHGGSGDVDLYVKRGVPPTTRSFDCRPLTEANNESCDLVEPGQYYIMLRAHEDYAGVSLTTKP